MWKIFFKKNIQHLKEQDLYLFIFSELENNIRLNEIKNHLINCNECNLKYISLKKNVEFLINNKDFLKNECFRYNNLVSNKMIGLFSKRNLAFFVIFICFLFVLFFMNYFNSQRQYYAKEEDINKLISLYKSINLVENDLRGYDKIALDFEDYFYEFENLFEID